MYRLHTRNCIIFCLRIAVTPSYVNLKLYENDMIDSSILEKVIWLWWRRKNGIKYKRMPFSLLQNDKVSAFMVMCICH